MSFKRVYVGDEPQFFPDASLGRFAERGDVLEFAEEPSHPDLVTEASARKAKVRVRAPREVEPEPVAEPAGEFAEVTPSDAVSDDNAQEG